jgi:hypothetical protein
LLTKIYWNTFSQQFLFDSVLSAKHELAEILGVTHGMPWVEICALVIQLPIKD